MLKKETQQRKGVYNITSKEMGSVSYIPIIEKYQKNKRVVFQNKHCI